MKVHPAADSLHAVYPELLHECWRATARGQSAAIADLLRPFRLEFFQQHPELGLRLCNGLDAIGATTEGLALARQLRDACAVWGNTSIFRVRGFWEATFLYRLGRVRESEDVARYYLPFALSASDIRAIARISMHLGALASFRGGFAEALSTFGRVMAIVQRSGDVAQLSAAHMNAANSYYELGRFDKAASHIDHGLLHARSSRSEGIVASGQLQRGLILNATGDSRLAEVWVRRALRHATRHRLNRMAADATRGLAVVIARLERPSKARGQLLKAIDMARACSAPFIEAEAFEELALLEQGAGASGPAIEALSSATRIFLDMGSEYRAQHALDRFRAVRAKASLGSLTTTAPTGRNARV